ncbi:hypothetical protein HB162lentus_14330 [Mammaliicoccus lentus]
MTKAKKKLAIIMFNVRLFFSIVTLAFLIISTMELSFTSIACGLFFLIFTKTLKYNVSINELIAANTNGKNSFTLYKNPDKGEIIMMNNINIFVLLKSVLENSLCLTS